MKINNLYAFMCGAEGITTRCASRTDLADWLQGFALACRRARNR